MRLLIVLGLACSVAVITAELYCEKYLVAEVADDKLTASSYWCQAKPCTFGTTGAAPKYGRLNSTGDYTGAWTALNQDQNQYIQVDFGSQKLITGVVLKARDYVRFSQWTKKFKFLTSSDCNDFQAVQENGADKVFDGNTGLDVLKTNYLSPAVTAQCVRINPTEWQSYVSLRFDIIGLDTHA